MPPGPVQTKKDGPIAELGRLLDEAGARLTIGLRQQGHLETVERMLREHHSWETIGRAIGWDSNTAAQWYWCYECQYASTLHAQRDALLDALKSIHDLLDGEIAERFRTSASKNEAEMGRRSVIYSLLSVPRNMAKAALQSIEAPSHD